MLAAAVHLGEVLQLSMLYPHGVLDTPHPQWSPFWLHSRREEEEEALRNHTRKYTVYYIEVD